MTETYRVVLLDQDNREVGTAITLSFNPSDVLVIMPESGAIFSEKMGDEITQGLDHMGIKGIVFHVPVQLARLEKA